MKIIKTYIKGKDISYQLPVTNKNWTVLFSNNISSIAFVGKNNLSNISNRIIDVQYINSNIVNLDDYCFNNCDNLNHMNLQPNILLLDIYCFNNCKKYKKYLFSNI